MSAAIGEGRLSRNPSRSGGSRSPLAAGPEPDNLLSGE